MWHPPRPLIDGNLAERWPEKTKDEDMHGSHKRTLGVPFFIALVIWGSLLLDIKCTDHILHPSFWWDVIALPCRTFRGGLVKPPIEIGHGWIITSLILMWIYLLRQALNPFLIFSKVAPVSQPVITVSVLWGTNSAHYNDVIMGAIASQITSLASVYSAI